MTHLESYPPCVLSWRSSKSEIFVPNQDVFILLMIHGICSAADKISPSARHTAQWLNPVQLRSRMILLYNIIAAMTTFRKCFCSSSVAGRWGDMMGLLIIRLIDASASTIYSARQVEIWIARYIKPDSSVQEIIRHTRAVLAWKPPLNFRIVIKGRMRSRASGSLPIHALIINKRNSGVHANRKQYAA